MTLLACNRIFRCDDLVPKFNVKILNLFIDMGRECATILHVCFRPFKQRRSGNGIIIEGS